MRRIRAHTTLPIALGFGISRPEHVAEVGAYADAAVVGSALVSLIAEAERIRRTSSIASRTYVRWLKGAAAPAGTSMPTLDDLRHDIDRVDEVLVRLLNERARVRRARSAG